LRSPAPQWSGLKSDVHEMACMAEFDPKGDKYPPVSARSETGSILRAT
jgi:hypothetical protein